MPGNREAPHRGSEPEANTMRQARASVAQDTGAICGAAERWRTSIHALRPHPPRNFDRSIVARARSISVAERASFTRVHAMLVHSATATSGFA
jgi:hypothetical protein